MDARRRANLRKDLVDRFGPEVPSFFERCDLAINRIEYLNARDLAVYLGLQARHRDRLGLRSDELLVVLLSNKDQFQWFHDEIRKRVRSYERLDRTAVVVISRDPHIRAKCADARPDPETGYLTSLVALGFADVGSTSADLEQLVRAFREQAFVADHFDCRVPVTGDNLFGRHQLVTQLEHDILRDGRPVGLFGLRRVGKSSVLSQLITQLRASTNPRIAVAVADLQRDSYNVTAGRVAAALYRDLATAAESIGSRFREGAGEYTPFDRVAAITRHLRKKGLRVVLALDEIEWLVPTNDEEMATRGRDFLSVLGSLRGLKHELKDDLGLVCCGINQYFTEIPTVLQYPNPVLDFFQCRYVAGLTRSDFDDMLKTLGHRMGISFAPSFLFEAFKRFGGHPYLARQFCSVVAQKERQRPALISGDIFTSYYGEFLKDKKTLVGQVMEYFRHFYPSEYEILTNIAHGRAAAVSDTAARHLQSYGLVTTENGTHSVKIDAVKQSLLDEQRERVTRAGVVLPDRFEVIEELGSGATARVFRVRDTILGEERAIKQYANSVSPLAVRGEFSVLREVRTPYVVTAYDVVKAKDGTLCLIMEHVAGRSLETVLSQTGAVAHDELVKLADQLFAALKSIHPDLQRIEQLQKLPELDDESMQEFLRLRNEGHLHRDIKPSNIVVVDERAWACKLVDLGLARPARAVGHTRVGTEAYLPPDVGTVRWSATFDLYALGVILFRAAYGQLPARDQSGNPQRPSSTGGVPEEFWLFSRTALAAS